MSDTSPRKDVAGEKVQQGSFMERVPKNLEGLTNLEEMEADFREALNIDKFLAQHLVRQHETTTFYTQYMNNRGNPPTARETLEVQNQIARWKAEFKAAREEIEKRKRDIDLLILLDHWKTFVMMHKRGCKPSSSALSFENSTRPTEDSDRESEPDEGWISSSASDEQDEKPVSGGASEVRQAAL